MRKGFTLVELMIVMVIIAILIAVLLPTFLSYRNDAYLTRAKAEVASIGNALNQWYQRTTPTGGSAAGAGYYPNPGNAAFQLATQNMAGLGALTNEFYGMPRSFSRVPADPFNNLNTYAYAIITGGPGTYTFSPGIAAPDAPWGATTNSYVTAPATMWTDVDPAANTQVGFVAASRGTYNGPPTWAAGPVFGTPAGGIINIDATSGQITFPGSVILYSNFPY